MTLLFNFYPPLKRGERLRSNLRGVFLLKSKKTIYKNIYIIIIVVVAVVGGVDSVEKRFLYIYIK